jgi:hypothetical protein
MTLPQAWMQQAESDYRAAQRVDNDADPTTRCQAISKYQQCVEKSVKAVLDRLYAAGITNAHSDRRHEVSRYVAVFRNVPRTRDTSGLLNQLARLFTDTVVAQVDLLDSLVPQFPAAGALAARNHEYPFQKSATDWRAPSSPDTFTTGEIRRIRNCAGSLIVGLRRIFDALELLFP